MFDKFRQSKLGEFTPPQPPDLQDFVPGQAEIPAPPEVATARQRRRKLTEIRQQAHQQLLEILKLSAPFQASEADIKAEVAAVFKSLVPLQNVAVSRSERNCLVEDLYYEVMGLGPLEILVNDGTVSDILINGPEQVFVEQGGLLELTDAQFQDEAHLRRILQKTVGMAGRRLDESTPYVDSCLPDSSRRNAVIAPIALDGTLVSIRKFRKDKLSLDQLAFPGAMNEKIAIYLRAAVAWRLNILISDGTGSGKTTLMNALSAFIGRRERIITVEDTAELQLQQAHVGRMERRPANIEGKGAITQRDRLRNALRMRPDRIIVGETRGDEMIDMLQAMNTGHDGSMTTIRSNSARNATSRLENMVATSGVEIPLGALRRQVASAVKLIVQVNRLQDGSRKATSVPEVTGCEGEVLTMQELFVFEHTGVTPDGRVAGGFGASGMRSAWSDRFRRWGITLPADLSGV